MRATVAFVIGSLLTSSFVLARQQAQQSQPQGGRGGPGGVARIVQFEAQPTTIKAGETVTLAWHVENQQYGMADEITGVGPVLPRGSKVLKPTATTTYTLMVGPPDNPVATKSITVTVPGTKPVVASRIVKTGIQRTPDGKVDFTGVYDFRAPAGGAARGAGGARGARGAAAPGGGQQAAAQGARGAAGGGGNVNGNCTPTGLPSYSTPYQFQIVQGPKTVVIFYEFPGVFRVVPLDGIHSTDPDPTVMGESVGRFEGDALVVDTIGFRSSETLHVVERFRRTDDALEISITREDSGRGMAAQTTTSLHRYVPEMKRIEEFFCAENQRDYNLLFEK